MHSNPNRGLHVFHMVSWLPFLLWFLSCLPAPTNDPHPASSCQSLPSAPAVATLLGHSSAEHECASPRAGSLKIWNSSMPEMGSCPTHLSKSSSPKTQPVFALEPGCFLGGFQHQSCGQRPCPLTLSTPVPLRSRSRWLSFYLPHPGRAR